MMSKGKGLLSAVEVRTTEWMESAQIHEPFHELKDRARFLKDEMNAP